MLVLSVLADELSRTVMRLQCLTEGDVYVHGRNNSYTSVSYSQAM